MKTSPQKPWHWDLIQAATIRGSAGRIRRVLTALRTEKLQPDDLRALEEAVHYALNTRNTRHLRAMIESLPTSWRDAAIPAMALCAARHANGGAVVLFFRCQEFDVNRVYRLTSGQGTLLTEALAAGNRRGIAALWKHPQLDREAEFRHRSGGTYREVAQKLAGLAEGKLRVMQKDAAVNQFCLPQQQRTRDTLFSATHLVAMRQTQRAG